MQGGEAGDSTSTLEGLVDKAGLNRLLKIDIVRLGDQQTDGVSFFKTKGRMARDKNFKKRPLRDKHQQQKLGYAEWRKREIERLVLQSRISAENKLEFLKEIRNA